MLKLVLWYLGHLMWRASSFEKTLMLGKIEGRRRRGRQRMRWLDGIINSVDMFSSVQSVSHVWLCDPMNHSMPGLPVHHQHLEFTQTHIHWVRDAIQPSHPLSSPSLPAFIFSQHQALFFESALHIRWPKYWSFSFSISPSNEYSGLISFRMDWLDLLAVQGAFKSLLQHHSSRASILRSSAFFIVQLSHPYMTTRKTKALYYLRPSLNNQWGSWIMPIL